MADDQVPNCHYCDNPAEAECPTCGRLYCSEHGEDVCLRCMAPESAAPSAAVYRGSVLALVIATLVVVFLLVRPPETKSRTNLLRDLPTSTAAVASTATPTRTGATTEATPRQGDAGADDADAHRPGFHRIGSGEPNRGGEDVHHEVRRHALGGGGLVRSLGGGYRGGEPGAEPGYHRRRH
ncbi:hypothetical protein [Candidatus Amarobacter glycogenicus]|uniref:hypothetical protein n=1 Tax=Candidatus Amarobacter glycogenicus TaxID=3140699 RepID=UPI0031CCBC5F